MFFKQFYLGCLAHASYLIGSRGVAAVVDPQRDVAAYLKEAEANNLKIKYVIETHLHADFVSGHLELAARTGAQVIVSRRAQAQYTHHAVDDGDEIKVGAVAIKVLATPGHTPESISLFITDKDNPHEPPKVLTGDTLFVGDVGRPDLVGADGHTASDMAAMLYDSLREKLLTLEDATEVYPAHGAGSLCGRNISKDNSSTIERERRTNYALQPMSKSEFVEMMTANLPEIPRYFPFDRQQNRYGAKPLTEISAPQKLTPDEVKRFTIDENYILLDVRTAAKFGTSHLPNSLNVGLNGQFATWAGSLIAPDAKIILIAETEAEVREAVVRLARVGLENVIGYVDGGVEAWQAAGNQIESLPQITVDELKKIIERETASANSLSEQSDAAPTVTRFQILDVRRPSEYANGHLPRAFNLPLGALANPADTVTQLDANVKTYVVCAGGYRSSAAASVLARHHFKNLINVTGGTTAWTEAKYDLETD